MVQVTDMFTIFRGSTSLKQVGSYYVVDPKTNKDCMIFDLPRSLATGICLSPTRSGYLIVNEHVDIPLGSVT